MKAVRDSLDRPLELARPAERIVSLVPSDTWSLAQLGVLDRVVGRTRYCVEPADGVAAIADVGGTKNPDVDRILALSPDLVVANQEESGRAAVLRLVQAGVPVYVSFPKRVADGLSHVAKLATLAGVEREATVRETLADAYRALDEATRRRATTRPVRTFYPIWADPLMTVSADTFVSDALWLAGCENVFADRERRYPLAADLGRATAVPPSAAREHDVRYPRITLDEVVERAPELVLLPDEPHEFSDTEAAALRALPIPAAEHDAIVAADGKDFSWYGLWAIERLARARAVVDSKRRKGRA